MGEWLEPLHAPWASAWHHGAESRQREHQLSSLSGNSSASGHSSSRGHGKFQVTRSCLECCRMHSRIIKSIGQGCKPWGARRKIGMAARSAASQSPVVAHSAPALGQWSRASRGPRARIREYCAQPVDPEQHTALNNSRTPATARRATMAPRWLTWRAGSAASRGLHAGVSSLRRRGSTPTLSTTDQAVSDRVRRRLSTH